VGGTGLPPMRVLVVADLHACDPYMPLDRVRAILEQAQGVGADLICLLGDYVGHSWGARALPVAEVAAAHAALSAPLGVWGVFGNHDWKDDAAALASGAPQTLWHRAFAGAGLRMLANAAVRIDTPGGAFNLAGLETQRGARTVFRAGEGRDDLPAVLDALEPGLPTLLMAHEPDIFADLPEGIALTLSGHTHGGQIRFFGRPWLVPSRHGTRYAYGHHRTGARHLVVSGGLGTSGPPLRIGMPPELTLVEVT
jgi:predicted MPP superfamily phosphohydrolase